MLPEKGIKCHRTFARSEGPLDCRTLVCDHGCRLWKRVTLENDPNNCMPGQPVKPIDHYDCADSLVDLYLKDMLRRQLQTTATVDELRKEVHQGNDQQMVGAIARLNRQMDEVHAISHVQSERPKLIEQQS